jgi:hypothetical protein
MNLINENYSLKKCSLEMQKSQQTANRGKKTTGKFAGKGVETTSRTSI